MSQQKRSRDPCITSISSGGPRPLCKKVQGTCDGLAPCLNRRDLEIPASKEFLVRKYLYVDVLHPSQYSYVVELHPSLLLVRNSPHAPHNDNKEKSSYSPSTGSSAQGSKFPPAKACVCVCVCVRARARAGQVSRQMYQRISRTEIFIMQYTGN